MSVPTFDEQDEIDASHKFFTSIIGTVDSGVSDNSERIKALQYAHMRRDLAEELLDSYAQAVLDSAHWLRMATKVHGTSYYDDALEKYKGSLDEEERVYNKIIEVMTGGTDD